MGLWQFWLESSHGSHSAQGGIEVELHSNLFLFMLLLCMITTALIFTILLARFCVACEVYSVKGQVAGVQLSVWFGPAKWEKL